MTSEPCDACGKGAHIAGDTGDLWNLLISSSGGMILELVDGSEHFPCFDCMERLPGDREPTAEDVAALQAPISWPCRYRDCTPERWT